MPDWVAAEIRNAWMNARSSGRQIQSFRILERMVERLGYGRLAMPIVTDWEN